VAGAAPPGSGSRMSTVSLPASSSPNPSGGGAGGPPSRAVVCEARSGSLSTHPAASGALLQSRLRRGGGEDRVWGAAPRFVVLGPGTRARVATHKLDGPSRKGRSRSTCVPRSVRRPPRASRGGRRHLVSLATGAGCLRRPGDLTASRGLRSP
jgi:hypothetical protein